MADTVRVRVLQLGRRVMEHTGQAGLTLGSLLEAVGAAAMQGMDLRVNGQPAAAEIILTDGDTVTIIPRIKGGRR